MRSLISLDFWAPEMEPESAHVASDVAICDAAPPRQHSPILNSALLRYSVLCFNSITNVIDTISNDGGVRKPSIHHLATYFPKQIPTPSRLKLILLIHNEID